MKRVTEPVLHFYLIFNLKKSAFLLIVAILGGLVIPEIGLAQRPDRTSNHENNRSNNRENNPLTVPESGRPSREVIRPSTNNRDKDYQNSNPRQQPSRTKSFPSPSGERYSSDRDHYQSPDRQRSRDLASGRDRKYRYPTYPSYPDAGRYNRATYRSPNWNYRNLPRRGHSVPFAPRSSITVAFGGVYFHYDNGVYYRPMNGRFVVVPAPIGLRTRMIPAGHLQYYINQRPYYYYYGNYYELRNGYYEVVRPPVGALVESIPDGYEEVIIDGETYYIVDAVQYKPVHHKNEIWYEVLKVDSY